MSLQTIQSSSFPSDPRTVIPIAADGAFGHHLAIVGDPLSERLLELAESVAPTRSTVLLTGESGVGKEVFARYIHRHSHFAGGPFIAVNCAALPESLIESELFGHERGAFSGAHQRRIGVFERAKGGTLLLDEISEVSTAVQAKLLRVLQERVVYRVGGGEPIPVDTRVIATTNRHLERCVDDGTFRRDLYYRINVFPIEIPSLRQRLGDVEPMVHYFLGKLARELDTEIAGVTPEAMQKLERYPFPGNVRELINILERAVILTGSSDVVDAAHIHLDAKLVIGPMASARPHSPEPYEIRFVPGSDKMADVRRRVILSTLARFDGNRTKTAESLGVSLRTIRNRLREYRAQGIPIPE